MQGYYNEFWTEKDELVRKKKNTLLEHTNSDEDSDVEHSSRHECLFYHHDDSTTTKYMIFTIVELKKFLLNEITKKHNEEHYSFETLEKTTGIALENIQNFFIPYIMVGDEGIISGQYTFEDGTTTNIHYIKGFLVNQLIKDKMSLDDFLRKYVEHIIKENLCYNVFSYWNSFVVDDFYIFVMED